MSERGEEKKEIREIRDKAEMEKFVRLILIPQLKEQRRMLEDITFDDVVRFFNERFDSSISEGSVDFLRGVFEKERAAVLPADSALPTDDEEVVELSDSDAVPPPAPEGALEEGISDAGPAPVVIAGAEPTLEPSAPTDAKSAAETRQEREGLPAEFDGLPEAEKKKWEKLLQHKKVSIPEGLVRVKEVTDACGALLGDTGKAKKGADLALVFLGSFGSSGAIYQSFVKCEKDAGRFMNLETKWRQMRKRNGREKSLKDFFTDYIDIENLKDTVNFFDKGFDYIGAILPKEAGKFIERVKKMAEEKINELFKRIKQDMDKEGAKADKIRVVKEGLRELSDVSYVIREFISGITSQLSFVYNRIEDDQKNAKIALDGKKSTDTAIKDNFESKKKLLETKLGELETPTEEEVKRDHTKAFDKWKTKFGEDGAVLLVQHFRGDILGYRRDEYITQASRVVQNGREGAQLTIDLVKAGESSGVSLDNLKDYLDPNKKHNVSVTPDGLLELVRACEGTNREVSGWLEYSTGEAPEIKTISDILKLKKIRDVLIREGNTLNGDRITYSEYINLFSAGIDGMVALFGALKEDVGLFVLAIDEWRVDREFKDAHLKDKNLESYFVAASGDYRLEGVGVFKGETSELVLENGNKLNFEVLGIDKPTIEQEDDGSFTLRYEANGITDSDISYPAYIKKDPLRVAVADVEKEISDQTDLDEVMLVLKKRIVDILFERIENNKATDAEKEKIWEARRAMLGVPKESDLSDEVRAVLQDLKDKKTVLSEEDLASIPAKGALEKESRFPEQVHHGIAFKKGPDQEGGGNERPERVPPNYVRDDDSRGPFWITDSDKELGPVYDESGNLIPGLLAFRNEKGNGRFSPALGYEWADDPSVSFEVRENPDGSDLDIDGLLDALSEPLPELPPLSPDAGEDALATPDLSASEVAEVASGSDDDLEDFFEPSPESPSLPDAGEGAPAFSFDDGHLDPPVEAESSVATELEEDDSDDDSEFDLSALEEDLGLSDGVIRVPSSEDEKKAFAVARTKLGDEKIKEYISDFFRGPDIDGSGVYMWPGGQMLREKAKWLEADVVPTEWIEEACKEVAEVYLREFNLYKAAHPEEFLKGETDDNEGNFEVYKALMGKDFVDNYSDSATERSTVNESSSLPEPEAPKEIVSGKEIKKQLKKYLKARSNDKRVYIFSNSNFVEGDVKEIKKRIDFIIDELAVGLPKKSMKVGIVGGDSSYNGFHAEDSTIVQLNIQASGWKEKAIELIKYKRVSFEVEKIAKSINKKLFFVYNNNKFKGESGESYRAILEKISRMVEDRGGVKSIKSQIGLFYDNSKFYNGRIQLNIDDSDWEKELSGFLDKQQYKKNLPEFIRKKRMKDRIKLYKNNEFSEDNVDLVEKRVEELTKLLKKNKNIEKVWLVGKDHASLKLTDDKGIQINIEQDSWKEKLARLAGLRPEDLGIEVNDREYEGHVKTESSASDDEELTESVSEIEITKEEVEGLTPLQKAIYKIYKKTIMEGGDITIPLSYDHKVVFHKIAENLFNNGEGDTRKKFMKAVLEKCKGKERYRAAFEGLGAPSEWFDFNREIEKWDKTRPENVPDDYLFEEGREVWLRGGEDVGVVFDKSGQRLEGVLGRKSEDGDLAIRVDNGYKWGHKNFETELTEKRPFEVPKDYIPDTDFDGKIFWFSSSEFDKAYDSEGEVAYRGRILAKKQPGQIPELEPAPGYEWVGNPELTLQVKPESVPDGYKRYDDPELGTCWVTDGDEYKQVYKDNGRKIFGVLSNKNKFRHEPGYKKKKKTKSVFNVERQVKGGLKSKSGDGVMTRLNNTSRLTKGALGLAGLGTVYTGAKALFSDEGTANEKTIAVSGESDEMKGDREARDAKNRELEETIRRPVRKANEGIDDDGDLDDEERAIKERKKREDKKRFEKEREEKEKADKEKSSIMVEKLMEFSRDKGGPGLDFVFDGRAKFLGDLEKYKTIITRISKLAKDKKYKPDDHKYISFVSGKSTSVNFDYDHIILNIDDPLWEYRIKLLLKRNAEGIW